ncbi:hypothetical protein ABTZ99_36490 [Actinosynnema sp. NPDC002837]
MPPERSHGDRRWEDAVNEFVDRAYLRLVDNGNRLRVAVPVHHAFLRARVSELPAVLDERGR